jgi:hypothetical protein
MDVENSPVITIRNGLLDAKWGGFVIDGNFFTRLVYAGV